VGIYVGTVVVLCSNLVEDGSNKDQKDLKNINDFGRKTIRWFDYERNLKTFYENI